MLTSELEQHIREQTAQGAEVGSSGTAKRSKLKKNSPIKDGFNTTQAQ